MVAPYRRLARKRSFFGVLGGASCALVAPRHASSPRPASVHRQDTAALIELAAIVKSCGGRAELVTGDNSQGELGRTTEFCVGGPGANPRTAAYLRSVLVGVRFEPHEASGSSFTFRVGATAYAADRKRAEYVVLARHGLSSTPNPIFIIAGQTALANLAATRFLTSRYRSLLRTYGPTGRFCLVLKVIEPLAFGPDFVEIVADATADAFQDHPAAHGAAR